MKALIVDGEELFRLSLKEVVSVAGGFNDVLLASDESQFMSLAAATSTIDLIVFHPSTLSGGGANCLSLARRLFPKAAFVTLLDPGRTSTGPWSETQIIYRNAGVMQIIRALRAAIGLPADATGVDMQSLKPSLATSSALEASPRRALLAEGAEVDLSRLSYRQRQILSMAADGLPNKEIAARLDIAEGTVKAHMHAIFKVMGVSNRTQAVIRYGAARHDAQKAAPVG